jgi:hypothetical protein
MQIENLTTMKLNNRILVVLGLTGILLSGCSEEETPNQKDKQLNKLSGTWVVTSATMGSMDYTEDYSNFELTLSGSSSATVYAYAVAGRPEVSPWLQGGTWSFGSDVKAMITRDPETIDELQMIYSATDTQLVVEFSFTGAGYEASRVNSVEGNWEYIFAKK